MFRAVKRCRIHVHIQAYTYSSINITCSNIEQNIYSTYEPSWCWWTSCPFGLLLTQETSSMQITGEGNWNDSWNQMLPTSISWHQKRQRNDPSPNGTRQLHATLQIIILIKNKSVGTCCSFVCSSVFSITRLSIFWRVFWSGRSLPLCNCNNGTFCYAVVLNWEHFVNQQSADKQQRPVLLKSKRSRYKEMEKSRVESKRGQY